MRTAERQPRREAERPDTVRLRCPYCHDHLSQEPGDDAPVLCLDCETPHHAECFREHRGCTQLGCRSREALQWTPEVAAPASSCGAGLAVLGMSLWFGVLAGWLLLPTRCGW